MRSRQNQLDILLLLTSLQHFQSNYWRFVLIKSHWEVIVGKSYCWGQDTLVAKKRFFRFRKSFVCYLIWLYVWVDFFPLLFINFNTKTILFFIFSFIFNGYFLRYLPSSSNRIIMPLRNSFVMYGTWFDRKNIFFKGTCLFNTLRNTCLKDSYLLMDWNFKNEITKLTKYTKNIMKQK